MKREGLERLDGGASFRRWIFEHQRRDPTLASELIGVASQDPSQFLLALVSSNRLYFRDSKASFQYQ